MGRSQSKEGGLRRGARDPADAAGPGSPRPRPRGEGKEGERLRTRVRSGAGRSGDLAAGEKAASEPRTRRAEGGERARTMGEKPGTR